jgi:hypothetical protein
VVDGSALAILPPMSVFFFPEKTLALYVKEKNTKKIEGRKEERKEEQKKRQGEKGDEDGIWRTNKRKQQNASMNEEATRVADFFFFWPPLPQPVPFIWVLPFPHSLWVCPPEYGWGKTCVVLVPHL